MLAQAPDNHLSRFLQQSRTGPQGELDVELRLHGLVTHRAERHEILQLILTPDSNGDHMVRVDLLTLPLQMRYPPDSGGLDFPGASAAGAGFIGTP